MWIVRWILTALIILLILGFALQNQEQTVSVRILNWTTPNLPLYFFLYAAFAAGVLIWAVVSAFHMLKLKKTIHRLEKKNSRTQRELDKLRNITIESEEEEEIPEPAREAPGQENQEAKE